MYLWVCRANAKHSKVWRKSSWCMAWWRRRAQIADCIANHRRLVWLMSCSVRMKIKLHARATVSISSFVCKHEAKHNYRILQRYTECKVSNIPNVLLFAACLEWNGSILTKIRTKFFTMMVCYVVTRHNLLGMNCQLIFNWISIKAKRVSRAWANALQNW